MTTQMTTYLADPVQLILDQFVLADGKTYGACIADFQLETFRAIFARHSNHRPKHRLCYLERRRGESKTTDIAAVALADLLTGPARHRSFAVAADEDQAALILESVEDFQARSPVLSGLKVQKNTVTNSATGSELRILAADARTNFGLRPRLVLFDELSQQRDRKLWTTMWTSVAKSPASQMIVGSMAGTDLSSIAWEVRQLAATKPAYYFQGRAGTQPAPWLAAEDLEEQRATIHPIDFAVYFEAQWSEPAGAWITSAMYDAIETGVEASGVAYPLTAVMYVDLGLRKDATAIAVCHGVQRPDNQTGVVTDTLRTLRGTKAEPVQLEAVEDLVVELVEAYRVRRVVFESWQGASSVQRLRKRLEGVSVEEQFPTAESMAKAWGGLYSLITGARLCVFPHAELRREMLALVVKSVGGRLKVVEGSTLVHQDHAVALAGACQLVTAQPVASPDDLQRYRTLMQDLATPSAPRPGFREVTGIPGTVNFPLGRVDR